MQFKVPQFLDIEDKIFGPFTFREFAYLAGGAGLCFVLYKLLGFIFGAIPILIIAGFSIALTFYKPNNKPFINMIEAGFKYFTQNKLYIWKKRMGQAPVGSTQQNLSKSKEDKDEAVGKLESKLNGSRLRDLAWSLDVLDLSKKKNAGS
jgi:hypothetical protein